MKYFYAVKPKSAGQNNFTPPPAKKKKQLETESQLSRYVYK